MRRRELLLALVITCGVCVACTAPPDGDAEPAATASEPAARVTPAAPATAPSPRIGCIRSGFTPAEVRVALGEPDSIAGGWWFYGRTLIQLSYGTVQDWIDPDSVVVC